MSDKDAPKVAPKQMETILPPGPPHPPGPFVGLDLGEIVAVEFDVPIFVPGTRERTSAIDHRRKEHKLLEIIPTDACVVIRARSGAASTSAWTNSRLIFAPKPDANGVVEATRNELR